MKIAFWLDPIEQLNPKKDTSLFLMLAAQDLGFQVYFFYQETLYTIQNQVFAEIHQCSLDFNKSSYYKIVNSETINLSEMDIIFIRKEPPVDRNYIYTCQQLNLLPSNTKIVNSCSGILTWNEKLSTLEFPQFTARTLVSQNLSGIKQFINTSQSERFTIKPIDGFGGRGILFLHRGDNDIELSLNKVSDNFQNKIIVQEFIPRANEGDKRVLLLQGEVLGAILRKAPDGQLLHNMDQGGKAYPTELTKREKEICQGIKKPLLDQGIFFAGIDFLGETLTEINITCPTGLQQLCTFENRSFHHEIIKNLKEL